MMADLSFDDLIPQSNSSITFDDLIPAAPAQKREPKVSGPRASQLGIQQGLTFGFGDEIMAALMTPVDMLISAATGEDEGKGILDRMSSSYNRQLEKERAELKTAREEHPIATGVGEAAGGLGTGGTLAKGGVTLLKVAEPTAKAMISRAAAEGAAYGAAYGLGEGEGLEDRLAKAQSGAILGGVAGGALGGLGARMAGKVGEKAVPTAEALKNQSNTLYKQAHDAGLVVKSGGFRAAVDDIAATVADEGIDATLHSKATAALGRLQKAAEEGKDLTLKEVDILRRVVGSAAKSKEPDEGRLATIIRDKLDDYLEKLAPNDVAAGDPKAAVQLIGEARDLWSRARKGEVIEDLLDRAKLSAPNFSASGMENAIRTEFRNLAKNPKAMRGFTKVEQAHIKRVAQGGPVENALRFLGKFAPTGLISSGVTGGAGFLLGGPAGAGAAMLAGAAGRQAATAMTSRNAARAAAVVRNGGRLPLPELPASAWQMLGALDRQAGQQGAGLPINRSRQ